MKFRIQKVLRGDKSFLWYIIQERRFFLWFDLSEYRYQKLCHGSSFSFGPKSAATMKCMSLTSDKVLDLMEKLNKLERRIAALKNEARRWKMMGKTSSETVLTKTI